MEKMPRELVFVRHGLSEANIVQKTEKQAESEPHLKAQAVYHRPDYEQRLSPEGVQQALAARRWMIDNCLAPEDFDQRYTSPFYRTMETAAKLGGEKSTWLPEVAIVERDWGLYGATPKKDRDEIFETVNHMKDTSSFFARLTNGESILDVNFRVRDFLGKLSREAAGLRVIAVTHGELMWTARFVIERMMPYEWQDLEANKSLRLGNCSILQYSRTNPSDPDDIVESLSSGWRRIYDPVNPERSPYKGDWHKLVGKRYISVGEISRIVEQRPRLIEASG